MHKTSGKRANKTKQNIIKKIESHSQKQKVHILKMNIKYS